MIKFGVIGYGYWGPNLVRNFMNAPGATVLMVCDKREERLKLVREQYSEVEVVTDHQLLIQHPQIDAVIIATPVSLHFDLAMAALKAGKHVFIEKPMTETTVQARQLIEEAERRHRVLMVDHTFIYTGAIKKIRELLDADELGDIYYYDSVRINLGLFQHDVNVIWDLAVHDVAIMDYILPFKPVAVAAHGLSHVPHQPENIAYLTIYFDQRIIAHIHVNWLAPIKIRHSILGASKKMVVYDDLDKNAPVKVYDKGLSRPPTESDLHEILLRYRFGDMWAPHIDGTEPLRLIAQHFSDCIRNQTRPKTDGIVGLRTVNILETATRSMHQESKILTLGEI